MTTIEEKIEKMIVLSTQGRLYLDLNDIEYIQKRIHQILERAEKEFPGVFLPPGESKYWCNPYEAAVWFKKNFGDKNE